MTPKLNDMTCVEARTDANRDGDSEEGFKHQVKSNIAEQEAEVKVAAIQGWATNL